MSLVRQWAISTDLLVVYPSRVPRRCSKPFDVHTSVRFQPAEKGKNDDDEFRRTRTKTHLDNHFFDLTTVDLSFQTCNVSFLQKDEQLLIHQSLYHRHLRFRHVRDECWRYLRCTFCTLMFRGFSSDHVRFCHRGVSMSRFTIRTILKSTYSSWTYVMRILGNNESS